MEGIRYGLIDFFFKRGWEMFVPLVSTKKMGKVLSEWVNPLGRSKLDK